MKTETERFGLEMLWEEYTLGHFIHKLLAATTFETDGMSEQISFHGMMKYRAIKNNSQDNGAQNTKYRIHPIMGNYNVNSHKINNKQTKTTKSPSLQCAQLYSINQQTYAWNALIFTRENILAPQLNHMTSKKNESNNNKKRF